MIALVENQTSNINLPSLGLLIAFVGVIIWLIMRSRQRGIEFREFAQKLGLGYTYFGFWGRKAVAVLPENGDWTATVKHLLSGQMEDVTVSVTDAVILESPGSGKESRLGYSPNTAHDLGSSRYTTVILMQFPGLNLPQFKISPREKQEDFMRGDPGIKGFEDFEFESSNRVDGDNPDRVVKELSPGIQKLLNRNTKWTVEGKGDVIVLFRYMKVISFGEIEQTIALGRKLLKAKATVGG